MAASAKRRPEPVASPRAAAGRTIWSPQRLIAALGGFLVAVALGLFGGLGYVHWQDTVAEAEQTAANLADLLAEHAGRVFDASNLVASQAILLAQNRDWAEIARSEAEYKELQRLSDSSDYISAVWLVDADGMPRLTSRGFPAPPISVADREHFQRQRESDRGALISTLLRSRVTGETNVVLSRRLEDGTGRFRGAALVVIDPNYFLSFYRSVRAVYPVAVDLFRSDLAVVVHYPELPEPEALALRKWPDRTERVAVGDSGVIYHASSALDRETWLEAYQRVRGFSLYVSVSVKRSAIRERWLDTMRQQGLFAGVALGALLLLVAVALARSHREELARRELERLTQSLEVRVRERTAEVERSADGLKTLLAEKDVLFREVHHRVKNNLQIISSLLNLFANKFANPEVQRSFADCLNQVRAMGLVHELLYRAPNVAEIDFDEYLRVLASRLAIFFGRQSQVRVDIRAAPLRFDLDETIPLALIVTEAMTNAFKHAFPDGRSGTIAIEVTESEEGTRIRVSDDGVGLPAGWQDFQERSLGMKLLHVLAEQIDAEIELHSDHGTTVALALSPRPRVRETPRPRSTRASSGE